MQHRTVMIIRMIRKMARKKYSLNRLGILLFYKITDSGHDCSSNLRFRQGRQFGPLPCPVNDRHGVRIKVES